MRWPYGGRYSGGRNAMWLGRSWLSSFGNKYALYGNDNGEQINPIEAGLGWICKDKQKVLSALSGARNSSRSRRKLVGLILEAPCGAGSLSSTIKGQLVESHLVPASLRRVSPWHSADWFAR